MHKENEKSIIIISHQERILNIADEIIVVAAGELKSQGTKDEILPQVLNGNMMEGCKYYNE
jgi:Fe-S cluster assembly ATP-binding protein